MNDLSDARNLKALFIDYLFKNIKQKDVIGSEIMFGSRKGVADLIMLSNGFTSAYEIKAQNDDFRKIKLQLDSYNKTFDYVYLITTEKHLLKAMNEVPKNNGIIIIYNDSSIKDFRESKQNIKLSKEEMLNTMTIKFLEKEHHFVSRKMNAYTLREALKKLDTNTIKENMYQFLYKRIQPRYSNFILERGGKTHFEDIALLSFKNKRVKI